MPPWDTRTEAAVDARRTGREDGTMVSVLTPAARIAPRSCAA
jgi:hypothetical protein